MYPTFFTSTTALPTEQHNVPYPKPQISVRANKRALVASNERKVFFETAHLKLPLETFYLQMPRDASCVHGFVNVDSQFLRRAISQLWIVYFRLKDSG